MTLRLVEADGDIQKSRDKKRPRKVSGYPLVVQWNQYDREWDIFSTRGEEKEYLFSAPSLETVKSRLDELAEVFG